MFTDSSICYIPKVGQYCPEGICDQLAISSSDNMDKYCDLYNHLENYVITRPCTIRPEVYLKHHLKVMGIPYCQKDIAINILRLNGKLVIQDVLTQKWI